MIWPRSTHKCPFGWLPSEPVQADYDLWLDPGMKDTAAISQLLTPFDAQCKCAVTR